MLLLLLLQLQSAFHSWRFHSKCLTMRGCPVDASPVPLSPMPRPRSAVSSGATTCCSFIHSICQFCTRQTNPTAAPTPTPTPNPTLHRHGHRRRFPARVKRLSRRTCSIFTASSSYPDDDDHHYDDRLQHDAAAATTTTITTTATATNY